MVEYKSKVFIWSLIAFIALLFAFNIFQLLVGASLLSLISIVFQGAVLFALLKKTLWVKTIVRVWSGFLAFSGLWPLFLAAPSMSSALLIVHILMAVIGLTIFFLSNRYIDVDEFAEIDWRKGTQA